MPQGNDTVKFCHELVQGTHYSVQCTSPMAAYRVPLHIVQWDADQSNMRFDRAVDDETASRRGRRDADVSTTTHPNSPSDTAAISYSFIAMTAAFGASKTAEWPSAICSWGRERREFWSQQVLGGGGILDWCETRTVGANTSAWEQEQSK